jgi:hypothetical protein
MGLLVTMLQRGHSDVLTERQKGNLIHQDVRESLDIQQP